MDCGYRAYFFGNMYFQGIHAGIQSAHVIAEMFSQYAELEAVYGPGSMSSYAILKNWAANHKTMILLNAGYSSELRSLIDLMNTPDNPYPWAKFNESEEAADGCLTSVGIILPYKVYDYAKLVRERDADRSSWPRTNILADNASQILTPWEIEMAQRLNQYSLNR